jgi:hypothetical protein
MTRWTGDQVSGGGRVLAYCQISLQHAQHVRSRYALLPLKHGTPGPSAPQHFHHARPGRGICSDACPTSVRLQALRRCRALPPAILRAARLQEAAPNRQHRTGHAPLPCACRTPPRHGGQCRCSHGGCRWPCPQPTACCGLAGRPWE